MRGEVYGAEEISDPFPVRTYIMYARELVGERALSSYEFACLFGSLGDFSLPLHSQKKRTALRRRR